jgi:hypothetical protein
MQQFMSLDPKVRLAVLAWVLWVVLPLVPSIIIYLIFPKTRVTAQGEINNWKIRSGGAFAAYIVCVWLGYEPFNRMHKMIDTIAPSVWAIDTEVSLMDEHDKPLNDRSLLKGLRVTLIPPEIKLKPSGREYEVKIPWAGTELPDYGLTFEIPQFGQADPSIYLQMLPKDAEIDYGNRHIKLPKTVISRFPTATVQAEASPTTASGNSAAQYAKPLSSPGPSPVQTLSETAIGRFPSPETTSQAKTTVEQPAGQRAEPLSSPAPSPLETGTP